ncbi:hypothetical protein DC498_12185 [Terrimonas sp.]|uniref:hypothetical protein n=1 Tax=Terrimonas sp. TaxID=1914338 RepID=UPI000D51D977|nr:hypothetical protein [Terrimonas sp.]PVD51808.1 hypothetical protein DC498_12185 [Terrimonas sp.]
MRNVVLLSIVIFALTACNNQKNNSSENAEEQTVTEQTTVGGDKDEHGCLTSAGETWSQLKQSCIQIFNVGQRLSPIETKDGEAVISAFVLFNDDKSEVELFLPNTKSNTILKTTDKNSYESGEYKFDVDESTLYINNEKKYKAE